MSEFFAFAAKEDRDPDNLISLLCGDVIETAIAHRSTQGLRIDGLTLDDCLAAAPAAPCLDSFAVRVCKYSAITAHEVLSILPTTSELQLQRHRVTLASGEQMILTFSLQLETTLRARYKGIATENAWFLRRITGECFEVTDCPSCTVGPEGVLERQLQALQQGDCATVFAFASPRNKLQTGPLERFEGMLAQPPYDALLGHSEVEVMQRKHLDANRFLALVRVQHHQENTPPLLFIWSITRQQDPADCWMTDGVSACTTAITRRLSDESPS